MIDAAIPDWPTLNPVDRSDVRDHCARFVVRQMVLAPAHIRFGMFGLFVVFRLFTLFRLGPRPLRSASREDRAAALAAFSAQRLSVMAGLERVIRSMTMIAFLDHPSVLSAMGEETLANPPSHRKHQVGRPQSIHQRD